MVNGFEITVLLLYLLPYGLAEWQISGLTGIRSIGQHTPVELLSLIKFECHGLPVGYHADRRLGCEVFHYCNGLGDKFTYKCDQGRRFDKRTTACALYPIPECEPILHKETRPKPTPFTSYEKGGAYSTSDFLHSFNNRQKQNEITQFPRHKNINFKTPDQKRKLHYSKNKNNNSSEDLGALSAFATLTPNKKTFTKDQTARKDKTRIERFTIFEQPQTAVGHTFYEKSHNLLPVINPIHQHQFPTQYDWQTAPPFYNKGHRNAMSINPFGSYANRPFEINLNKKKNYDLHNFADQNNKVKIDNNRFKITSGLPVSSHYSFQHPGSTKTITFNYDNGKHKFNEEEDYQAPATLHHPETILRYEPVVGFEFHNDRLPPASLPNEIYFPTTQSSLPIRHTDGIIKYTDSQQITNSNKEITRNPNGNVYITRAYPQRYTSNPYSISTPSFLNIITEPPTSTTERSNPQFGVIDSYKTTQLSPSLPSKSYEYDYNDYETIEGAEIEHNKIPDFKEDQLKEKIHTSSVTSNKNFGIYTTPKTITTYKSSTIIPAKPLATIQDSSERTPLEKFRELTAFHRAKLDSKYEENVNFRSGSNSKNNMGMEIRKIATKSNKKNVVTMQDRGIITSSRNLSRHTKRRRPVLRKRPKPEARAPENEYIVKEIPDSLPISKVILVVTTEKPNLLEKVNTNPYPALRRKRPTLKDIRERFLNLKMRRKSTRLPKINRSKPASKLRANDYPELKNKKDVETKLSDDISLTNESSIPNSRLSSTTRDTNISHTSINSKTGTKFIKDQEAKRYSNIRGTKKNDPTSSKMVIVAKRKISPRPQKRRRLSNPNARARFREFLRKKVNTIEEKQASADDSVNTEKQADLKKVKSYVEEIKKEPNNVEENLDTRIKRLTNDVNFDENKNVRKKEKLEDVIQKPYRYLLNRPNNLPKVHVSPRARNKSVPTKQTQKYIGIRNKSSFSPVTNHKIIHPTDFKQLVEMSPRPVLGKEKSNQYLLDNFQPLKKREEGQLKEKTISPASSIFPKFEDVKKRKYVRKKNNYKRLEDHFGQFPSNLGEIEKLPQQPEDVFKISKNDNGENRKSTFNSKPYFNLDSIKRRSSKSRLSTELEGNQRLQSMLDSHPFLFSTEIPRLPLEYILPLT